MYVQATGDRGTSIVHTINSIHASCRLLVCGSFRRIFVTVGSDGTAAVSSSDIPRPAESFSTYEQVERTRCPVHFSLAGRLAVAHDFLCSNCVAKETRKR